MFAPYFGLMEVLTALAVATLVANPLIASAQLGKDSKIVILGAGMSGISAAKRLKELGYTNFEIIEASKKVGGRVMHEKLGDITVEMGHIFTIGLGSNPIWSIIKQYNVSHQIVNYDDWTVRDTDSTVITEEANNVYEEFIRASKIVDKIADQAREDNTPDFTARSAFLKAGWSPYTFLDDVIEYFEIDWMYGFNSEERSGKYLFLNEPTEFVNSTDDVITYDNRGLAEILRQILDDVTGANDDKLKVSKVVTEIEQKDNQILVKTKDGERFTADYAIITFSVGVLQSREVTFKPDLPEWKTDSIQQFQMAQFTNIYVQFESTFWDDTEWIVYAGETDNFNIILNMNKYIAGSNILYLEATNKAAIRIERLNDTVVIAEVAEKLQKIYGPAITVPDPKRYKISRFSKDPLFYGAWSCWPPGYTKDSHNALKAPVDRLYFSGEHTSFINYGYLQGAYFSGVDTANMLHRCIHQSVCQDYVPVHKARGCRYTAAANYDHKAKEDDGSCRFPCVSGTKRNRLSTVVLIVCTVLMIL